MASLSLATVPTEVCLVLTPPIDVPYLVLKRELIRRTADWFRSAKAAETHERLSLGDRKPSQFFRRMRQLWSERTDDDFLRELTSPQQRANGFGSFGSRGQPRHPG